MATVSAEKQPGRSIQIAVALMHKALQVLHENANEMSGRQLLLELDKRVPLDEWARARYEKTGYIRWQSILHFYSIDAVKAGFITKKKGVWYLTPEGVKALTMSPTELFEHTKRAYADWRKQNPAVPPDQTDKEVEEKVENRIPTIDEIDQQALEGIQSAIDALTAYEFQDLAAALLRGMGYYTPFVAPVGKDGGVDIIAYRDPLGTSSPRIKVQIKHRETGATVQEVRELMGLLQKDGDVGIFISSGGFSPDAKTTARTSHVHVELIDSPRFITLWQEFYEKLTDEDKSLLPLRPVYFFTPAT